MAEVFEEITAALVGLEEKKTLQLAQELVQSGYQAHEVIEKGLSAGMQRIGVLWEEGEFFLPQLMKAAQIMQTAMTRLRPHLLKQGKPVKSRGKVVIGTVAGDIHDIGKTLVAAMLEADGFEVLDLGRDVPLTRFIEVATQEKADIIGLSALLTTTMLVQRRLIELLEEQKRRTQFKVIVGGSPVTLEWSQQIKADGYAPNAMQAVTLAKELLQERCG